MIMTRLKRTLKLTLLAEVIVIVLSYVVGTMVGAIPLGAFFYLLIEGGGFLFIPFFIITLLYLQSIRSLSRKFPKLRTSKGRIYFGGLLLLTFLCLVYLALLIINRPSDFSEAIGSLQIMKIWAIYFTYFIVMVFINERLPGP